MFTDGGNMTAVLLSGGIDSLVCAELARQAGELTACVFVDYGHPAQIAEGWRAFAYAGSRGVPLLAPHVRDLQLGAMSTADGPAIVPHRNAILLAVAANAATAHGATSLTIGVSGADQAAYQDCRPAFIDAMASALGMPIFTPLVDMQKTAVVRRAAQLGLTRDDAWPCYRGGPSPCGQCASCQESARAWRVLEQDLAG
jgi:7-cyano-7-deazaguanine synthase